jgi:hypothetical protein
VEVRETPTVSTGVPSPSNDILGKSALQDAASTAPTLQIEDIERGSDHVEKALDSEEDAPNSSYYSNHHIEDLSRSLTFKQFSITCCIP